MTEPFMGEIRMFAGNFALAGWAFCDGSEVPIQQFAAVYSIFGSTYGSTNPIKTFALPNLRGRVPMGVGQGTGMTKRTLGEAVGAEAVALEPQNIPTTHTHTVTALQGPGLGSSSPTPSATAFIGQSKPDRLYAAASKQTISLAPQMVSWVGAGDTHSNMQPYLVVNFITCLQGQYPPMA